MASSQPADLPTVHVAVATYNGRRWIEQQVRSILDQDGVQVTLTISDDGSTDGTAEWICQLAQVDSRVTVLPSRTGEPGVGANFLYTLNGMEVREGEYAAFADQDDIWRPGKLAHQVQFLRRAGVNAVSSNVLSFKRNPDGTLSKHVIRKDQPQAKWDFVFEAPGPGSTFLMDYESWSLIVNQYRRFGADGVWLHDWYVYALVRAAGLSWMIDKEPQVAYRQHSENALGEHSGTEAVLSRFRNLRSGKYREQFLRVAHDAARVADEAGADREWQNELAEMTALLENTSISTRVKLFARFPQIRRRRMDGFALAVARLIGVW
ncbi:glycosyltransferase [Actinomycetaceae bacterium MB13-C1-2]|nr:glycosyltransferase [Actinomycetaceae bacterium MB13-C1-2]